MVKPPTGHLYRHLVTCVLGFLHNCDMLVKKDIKWKQVHLHWRETCTCCSRSWKQNRDENGSNVNHRERCSQRLVTKLLKPLWNRLWLQLSGYGVEIILATINPPFFFPFLTILSLLRVSFHYVTHDNQCRVKKHPVHWVPKQMCSAWPEQVKR